MRQRQANDWFEFKQFRVRQGRSAMKVTTHACLFGASVPMADARRILDIGCGTGLLALMLAQRSQAQIDAVEIDVGACQDANRNFTLSAWPERLRLHQGAIQDFCPEAGVLYDRIVSNPPFFSASWRAEDSARNLARHDDALPLTQLLVLAAQWLAPNGELWLLLPVEADQRWRQSLLNTPLQNIAQLNLRASPDKPVTRRILTFRQSAVAETACAASNLVIARRELCIHGACAGYSAEAHALLRPYYASL